MGKLPAKPCEVCKRKPNCPAVCFPLKDWKRAMEKRGYKTNDCVFPTRIV